MKTVSTHEICSDVLVETVRFWQKLFQNLMLQIGKKKEELEKTLSLTK